MAKERVLPSFLEVCRTAWDECSALWPLFLVMLSVLILQYATLFLCVLLLCLPFLHQLGRVFSEDPSAPADMGLLLEQIGREWVDPSRVLPLLGILLLYATWWSLLSAVADGGVFAAFWRRKRKGEGFSLSLFFKDGLRLFVPMVLLDLCLFLLGFGCCLPLVLGGALLVLGVTSASQTALLLTGLLVGLPLILLGILLLILFVGFNFTATACVARGSSAWVGLQEAWTASRADGWRSLKGNVLILLIYIILSGGVSLVLNGLSLLPFVGWIFTLVDYLTAAAFTAGYMVFAPALAVHYLAEAGRKS